jgi:KAP family P-loop domain
VAPPRRVFISFDQSDQAQALDLIDRLRKASIERVTHLPDADSAVVLARDDKLGNAADIEGIHFRAQEPGFVLVPAILGGANSATWPRFLQERPSVNLLEPGGHEFLLQVLTAPPLPELSSSVTEARRRVLENGDQPVNALALAGAVASVHPDYGGNRLGRLYVKPDGPQRPVDEWLRDVRTLFSEVAQPKLHSRAVVIGLGLLDPVAREAYKDIGLEEALIGELREPLQALLTPRGVALWSGQAEPPPPPPPTPPPTPGSGATVEETVPTHTDNPATVDELGREGLARVLARRIRDMREQETRAGDREHPRGRSFLVHLHAPWGMGKTSLLNFLRRELGPARGEPWIVVDFNAWRHQRTAPPWWWLMIALYHQGLKELKEIDKLRGEQRARKLMLREWWWRLRGGLPGIVMLLLGAIGIVIVWQAGFFDALWGGETDVSTLTSFLVAVAAIITPLLTIWGALRAGSRWLLTTSARGARAYIQNTRDPMETVQAHFDDLVRWLHYPVVLLIDDLDRCKGPYVVELLEGIQTLFREQPVAYVVAADREWLSDAYQQEYRDFVSTADEPGRPLGYLFLEKTFQMSVTLPAPVGDARDAFWDRLIRPGEQVDRAELAVARKEADADFAGLASEDTIRRKLVQEPGSTPAEVQARREAAAVQLATPAAAKEAEHALRDFTDLLDPNPRAMKRLVNAYGIARGIETLSGDNLAGGSEAQQQTALWTILSLRWPRLADHLAGTPADVAFIGDDPVPDTVPEQLRALFHDQRVIDVVNGDGVEASLDAAIIARCAGQVQV